MNRNEAERPSGLSPQGQELLKNPREVLGRILRELNAKEPKYPTDPAEAERRFNLLEGDSMYQALRQSYDNPATTEADRDEIYDKLSERRRGIMTNSSSEGQRA